MKYEEATEIIESLDKDYYAQIYPMCNYIVSYKGEEFLFVSDTSEYKTFATSGINIAKELPKLKIVWEVLSKLAETPLNERGDKGNTHLFNVIISDDVTVPNNPIYSVLVWRKNTDFKKTKGNKYLKEVVTLGDLSTWNEVIFSPLEYLDLIRYVKSVSSSNSEIQAIISGKTLSKSI